MQNYSSCIIAENLLGIPAYTVESFPGAGRINVVTRGVVVAAVVVVVLIVVGAAVVLVNTPVVLHRLEASKIMTFIYLHVGCYLKQLATIAYRMVLLQCKYHRSLYHLMMFVQLHPETLLS